MGLWVFYIIFCDIIEVMLIFFVLRGKNLYFKMDIYKGILIIREGEKNLIFL